MTRTALLASLIFLIAPAGQSQTRVAKDLRPQLDELEKKAVALVQAMPDDKLGWAPPGARSFREAALHMAFGNYLLLNFTKGKTPSQQDVMNKISQHEKFEKASADKAQVVKTINGSFAAVRTALDGKSEAEMAAIISFFGQEKSTGGMFAIIVSHGSEHLGQLIAYARMCGVKAPWSN